MHHFTWHVEGAGSYSELRFRCIRRLSFRYHDENGLGTIPPEVVSSLDHELKVFAEFGVLGALVRLAEMWEPVASQNAPWAVQGSAASSLVLFGIGMLPFCPADHRLLFDRFVVAFRERRLEIDIVVSPEVMAIFRGLPVPGDTGTVEGIALRLIEYPTLDGHLHWEKVQPSLRPPSKDQVQQIIAGLQTNAARDLDFISTGLDFVAAVQPITFEDFVICQQLDDPGRISAGWPERVRRSRDERAAAPQTGEIDAGVLLQARGLPMFQEDLMAILSRFGGLDPIDAYRLVSAMALHRTETVRQGEQAFIEGAARNGLSRPHAESLFEIVSQGAPLATCKAHAISMAYLTAGLALGG